MQPILDNLKFLKKNKIWLEITTLIIPDLNDSEEELLSIAKFIKNELGAETPWHVSRFFPQYKLKDQNPTDEEIIHKAYALGKEIGLKYVYAGNIVSDIHENTYCPNCNRLVIRRTGYNIDKFDKNDHCPKCNTKIDLILK